MKERRIEQAATTEGLPVAPTLGAVLADAHLPAQRSPVDRRVVYISAVAVALGIVAALAAQGLILLIAVITNLAFRGELGAEYVAPAVNNLGIGVVFVPVLGGVIVGLMARFGSPAIRGHGIPETMEKVLLAESRIPARVTFFKPLSAAVSIGTGGPFGAEGPIIATGGALGSLLGQVQRVSAMERKTLLASGAAAGMAATFGSPVSAVLLAIELLLFEYRPRSIIPVALAATAAAGVRIAFEGAGPVFTMPTPEAPGGVALATYVGIGAVLGVLSVLVTRAVYAIEDAFELLPIHWMWWPVLGMLVVGVVGFFAPATMGVGYGVIEDLLSGKMAMGAVAFLCAMKFLSWSVCLGSGTSGGTLAPLFIIGGASGSLLAVGAAAAMPGAGIDPRIGALVGMAALFAGASRALLASVVFAFETTLQPLGLLPLLGGCSASFLVSSLLMRQSIMTEKISRRGVRVPGEYESDVLDRVLVRDVAASPVATLRGDMSVAEVRRWLASRDAGAAHTGFPIVDEAGILAGVLTRRDLLGENVSGEALLRDLLSRPPVLVYDDLTLRDAVDHMVRHHVGRLPVVRRGERGTVVGIVTRSDVLAAYRQRLREQGRSRGVGG